MGNRDMVHIKNRILILTLLGMYTLYAPPVTYQQLAVVAGVLKPEAQKFSLATGRAYLNYAKNLYKFGPEESAVTQLARNPKVGLFNLNTNAVVA